jgi:hypothetical protein
MFFYGFFTYDTPPHSLKDSNVNMKVKTMEGIGVKSLAHNTSGVDECIGALGWGLGRVTSGSIIFMGLHKPNNKLISAWLVHFWCTDKPQAYINSQDSSRSKLGGSHHLPTYSIFYD